MLKLQDVFDQLTAGELRQLEIGGAEQGKIAEANYPTILAHINLGLMALYKRFTLKENRLVVKLYEDIFTYRLQSQYALNGRGSALTERYIIDTTGEPFKDDVIKVKKVIATDSQFELALNDYSNCMSIVTPSLDSIRVPAEIIMPATDLQEVYRTKFLTVVYQASHPVIKVGIGYFDPERTNVELPPSHLQALLYFVASRINNPIGMTQEFNAGNNWNARYEQECAKLEDEGGEVDQGSQNTRAQRNGWV